MSLLGLLEQVCSFFPRQITCLKRIRGCFSLVHRGSSSFFLAPVLPCGSGQLEPRATDRSIYTHMILLYFPHQINVALDSSCRPLKRRSVVAERKRSRSPSMSSLLSRLRLVTVDVTGTLIAYRGQLGDYYCMAAKSAGMPCPDYGRVHEGFKLAYDDMSRRHPCFGHAAAMPAAEWWKTCVRDSFVRAGYDYDDETFERIFRRIYSTFGSAAPYAVFPDAQRFLRWLRKEGLVVGIVSNAEHRYRDVVLPALGLNQGSEWDFGVFSGVVGVEKPNPRIYEAALRQAAGGGVAPEEALHIGDSLRKDYAPARSLGMHALLLDRFRTAEAESWRRSGAPVLPDLVAAQEWLAGGHSHREEANQPVTDR